MDNRRHFIGGSDAAAIMGCDPYQTERELAALKLGLTEPPDLSNNPHIRRGVTYETLARKAYRRRMKGMVETFHAAFMHPEYSFIQGHVDGVWQKGRSKPETRRLLEIKCPSTWMLKKIQREGLPLSYVVQVQHYMMLKDIPRVADVVLWDAEAADIYWPPYEVKADEELQAHMLRRYIEFWAYIEAKELPPERAPAVMLEPLNADIRDKTLFAVDGPEWADRYQALKEARAMLREAELGEKAVKQAIIEAMDDHDAVVFDGQPIYNILVNGRETMDKKAIARDYPDINFDLYKKRSAPFRTFKPYLREDA